VVCLKLKRTNETTPEISVSSNMKVISAKLKVTFKLKLNLFSHIYFSGFLIGFEPSKEQNLQQRHTKFCNRSSQYRSVTNKGGNENLLRI